MGGGGGGSSAPQRIITDDMHAAAQVATEQWNDYQTRFAPFENKFIASSTKDPAVKTGAMQGMTNADIAQQVGKAPLAPDVMALQRAGQAGGSASGNAAATAALAARTGQVQGLQTSVAMGRGQAVEAVKGMTDMAIDSSNNAWIKEKAKIESDWNKNAATMNMAGSLVGAAAGIGGAAYKAGLFSGRSATDINDPARNVQGNADYYWDL